MADRSIEQELLEAIGRHAEHPDGAQLGTVIEDVLEETGVGIGRLSSVLQSLHAQGRIRQPEATTVEKVDPATTTERVAP